MIVTFAIIVTLTIVCSAASNADLNLVGQHYEGGNTFVDSFIETRRKRSLIGLGASALKTLLQKTSHLKHSYIIDQKYRNHMKYGDDQTALKDFESVNPVSVQTRTTGNGVKIITGVVGDKKLKIRIPGYKFNSEAVLDIIDIGKRVPGKPYIDSIIYTKKPYGKNY